MFYVFFFFQAEDGIRDLVRSRGLGDVYKRQGLDRMFLATLSQAYQEEKLEDGTSRVVLKIPAFLLSLIHI